MAETQYAVKCNGFVIAVKPTLTEAQSVVAQLPVDAQQGAVIEVQDTSGRQVLFG